MNFLHQSRSVNGLGCNTLSRSQMNKEEGMSAMNSCGLGVLLRWSACNCVCKLNKEGTFRDRGD